MDILKKIEKYREEEQTVSNGKGRSLIIWRS